MDTAHLDGQDYDCCDTNNGRSHFLPPVLMELEQGILVPLFGRWVTAPALYLLVTTPSSRREPVVQEFSDWVLGQAGDASRAV